MLTRAADPLRLHLSHPGTTRAPPAHAGTKGGALEFLGFYGLRSTGGLCWIPPVLCFCMLVGLGLDYHVFLLSRVVEFRLAGFGDREAVLLGLAKTGTIITAAGMIMALAFLGTLFAHEPLLAQLSFFVIVAVLVDTFIVRSVHGCSGDLSLPAPAALPIPVGTQPGTGADHVWVPTGRSILVPSMMVLLGKWNWWWVPPHPPSSCPSSGPTSCPSSCPSFPTFILSKRGVSKRTQCGVSTVLSNTHTLTRPPKPASL